MQRSIAKKLVNICQCSRWYWVCDCFSQYHVWWCYSVSNVNLVNIACNGCQVSNRQKPWMRNRFGSRWHGDARHREFTMVWHIEFHNVHVELEPWHHHRLNWLRNTLRLIISHDLDLELAPALAQQERACLKSPALFLGSSGWNTKILTVAHALRSHILDISVSWDAKFVQSS